MGCLTERGGSTSGQTLERERHRRADRAAARTHEDSARTMSVPFKGMLPSFDVERVVTALLAKPFPFLDNPLFTKIAFQPRRWQRDSMTVDGARDGTIRVVEDETDAVDLGYRFYRMAEAPAEGRGGSAARAAAEEEGKEEPTAAPPAAQAARPAAGEVLVLYFGRSTDVAADMDDAVGHFREALGAHLLAVDYRGYGWSTGRPLLSALTTDADVVLDKLGAILADNEVSPDVPVVLYGCGLGSQPAIYLAHRYPERFACMVLQSGFTHQLHLPMVRTFAAMFPGGQAVSKALPDIYRNEEKLREVRIPCLVVHGAEDEAVPIAQGESIFNAVGSEDKRFERIEGAGHEDLLQTHRGRLLGAVRALVEDVIPRAVAGAGEASDAKRRRDPDEPAEADVGVLECKRLRGAAEGMKAAQEAT